ncbi:MULTISPECIES: sensor histidine kinase [Sphingomonas]|uniref:sensor histidine kinase n=1 Tax=Sphingomonas TaxID=13687 RepID=UPI000DEFA1DD|nr:MULTISPECIES: ATP-binding protein [Sphingomonas]
MPITLRIALFAGLLALASNLAVIGFVNFRTHDEMSSSRVQQEQEQGEALADVYRSRGLGGLRNAVVDADLQNDPQAVVAILDRDGTPLVGSLGAEPEWKDGPKEGYLTVKVHLRGDSVAREASVRLVPIDGQHWLLTGRLTGEEIAVRDILERSLLIGLAIAVLLGLLTGGLLAQFVERRVRDIVGVTSAFGAGDFAQRLAAPTTGGDAFAGLSRQINHMLDRIATLMEELRMLTDSLAHDLRSPVSRLRSAADAAVNASDERERDFLLGNVIAQADSLMRVLTTVLEIGRSESMTARSQFTRFDPDELGRELVEMYEPVAEEQGVTLIFDGAARVPTLAGHRQLLAQALSNLIENSLAYGAAGGQIRVFIAGDGDVLRMGVADRGPGIPPERLEEARRRFGRLDPSRSRQGAGLGLALVQAIAHLHDGKLVLSDNRPGLNAELELPLARKSDAAA